MKKYEIFSQTTPAKIYIILEDDMGRLTCTCPAGKYRGRCKHIAALQEMEKEDRESMEQATFSWRADLEFKQAMDEIRPEKAGEIPVEKYSKDGPPPPWFQPEDVL